MQGKSILASHPAYYKMLRVGTKSSRGIDLNDFRRNKYETIEGQVDKKNQLHINSC